MSDQEAATLSVLPFSLRDLCIKRVWDVTVLYPFQYLYVKHVDLLNSQFLLCLSLGVLVHVQWTEEVEYYAMCIGDASSRCIFTLSVLDNWSLFQSFSRDLAFQAMWKNTEKNFSFSISNFYIRQKMFSIPLRFCIFSLAKEIKTNLAFLIFQCNLSLEIIFTRLKLRILLHLKKVKHTANLITGIQVGGGRSPQVIGSTTAVQWQPSLVSISPEVQNIRYNFFSPEKVVLRKIWSINWTCRRNKRPLTAKPLT